jgi:hypothetical protein
MNNDFLTTIIILAAICFLLFIIFSTMNVKKEGFDKNKPSDSKSSANSSPTTSTSNGNAGNAAAYTANIQSQVIKLQDTLLISKYRKDYENAVLALDDLVDNLMLEATLSMDSKNPQKSLMGLVGLNNAKTALNNVMKFIDTAK